jgi:hypothetical protein
MENTFRLDQIEVTASIHILCLSVIGISSRMDCPMFVFQLPDNDFRLKKIEIKLSNYFQKFVLLLIYVLNVF